MMQSWADYLDALRDGDPERAYNVARFETKLIDAGS